MPWALMPWLLADAMDSHIFVHVFFLFCGISMSRSCTSAASTGTRRSSASPSSSVAQIGATCQLKTLTLQKTASFPWLPQLHLFILPGRGVPHSSLAQLPWQRCASLAPSKFLLPGSRPPRHCRMVEDATAETQIVEANLEDASPSAASS